MVLTPSLADRKFGGSVRGVTSTGCSLVMPPKLSVGDVGEAAVGARLAPELTVRGVESRARKD